MQVEKLKTEQHTEPRWLSLEEVIGRITSDRPITWRTVAQGDQTFDVAIAAGDAVPR
jgi:hypothetical protein